MAERTLNRKRDFRLRPRLLLLLVRRSPGGPSGRGGGVKEMPRNVMSPQSTGPGGRRRTDAVRNELRLRAAAREAIAEHGLGVGVEEIVRRAGVGAGTLYRHFPRPQDLVDAVVLEALGPIEAEVAAAAKGADPWEAFAGTLRALTAAMAENRGFLEAVERSEASDQVRLCRERILESLEEVTSRAQRAGRLRSDVTLADLASLLHGVVGPPSSPGAVERWPLRLQIVLTGMKLG